MPEHDPAGGAGRKGRQVHGLRDLDYDDPEFTAKQAALLAEPAVTENRPPGDTIGQYWQTLEGDEARGATT